MSEEGCLKAGEYKYVVYIKKTMWTYFLSGSVYLEKNNQPAIICRPINWRRPCSLRSTTVWLLANFCFDFSQSLRLYLVRDFNYYDLFRADNNAEHFKYKVYTSWCNIVHKLNSTAADYCSYAKNNYTESLKYCCRNDRNIISTFFVLTK